MNGMRKALPPRPSQDLGYGGSPSLNGGAQFGGQNGYENRPGTSNGNMRKPPLQGPNGAVILDGYRNEIMNGFEGKPRFNPVSIVRKGSVLEWGLKVKRILVLNCAELTRELR